MYLPYVVSIDFWQYKVEVEVIIAHKLAVCLRNSTPNILAERMDKRYIDKQWVLDKNV